MALDRLEVYLLAADNPIGRKQLRPIFRRKRSREVLTREQVTAIKLGRRVLRKEMKAQGLKRRIDFEVTATNLGLYFDKNRFLWPFFLWLIRSHTVAKVMATTAVLTMTITTTVPVIRIMYQYITEYIIEYVYQYIDKIVYEYITEEKDRFTINLDPELFNKGFVLSETADFANPTDHLVCDPAVGIPCLSIRDIPPQVDTIQDGEHHDTYFAYTFYCRYESDTADEAKYNWFLQLTEETQNLSAATWIMVFEDGKMNFYAELGADGETETIPARDETGKAYAGAPLRNLCKTPDTQYEVIQQGAYYDYIRVVPQNFVSEYVAAQGQQTGVKNQDIHKYTVVIWLEGDDPDCTNDMIGASIGMTFKIQLEDELTQDNTQPTDPTTPTTPSQPTTPTNPTNPTAPSTQPTTPTVTP